MREMIFARDIDPAIGTREHAHTPSSRPIKGAGIHGSHRHHRARPFIMDRAMDPGVHGNRDDGEKRTPCLNWDTLPSGFVCAHASSLRCGSAGARYATRSPIGSRSLRSEAISIEIVCFGLLPPKQIFGSSYPPPWQGKLRRIAETPVREQEAKRGKAPSGKQTRGGEESTTLLSSQSPSVAAPAEAFSRSARA